MSYTPRQWECVVCGSPFNAGDRAREFDEVMERRAHELLTKTEYMAANGFICSLGCFGHIDEVKVLIWLDGWWHRCKPSCTAATKAAIKKHGGNNHAIEWVDKTMTAKELDLWVIKYVKKLHTDAPYLFVEEED